MIEGNLRLGERLRIKLVPPGMKPMTFKPEVYIIVPNEAIDPATAKWTPKKKQANHA